MEHVCIITSGYPTEEDPQYAFIKPVVDSLVDLGVKCSVIAPQSLTKILFNKRIVRQTYWQDTTIKGNKVDIYQPKYVSFSRLKLFGYSISYLLENIVIKKTFYKLDKPTVLYGHFWKSGMSAAMLKQKIPIFVASGESKIGIKDSYPEKFIQKHIESITGAIFVSTKNKDESFSLGLVSKQTRTIVIPNAIDHEKFYKQDKIEARKKLGFNTDDFIVAFTGAFTERKGVSRLSKAINEVGDIKSIFIGKGELKPECDGILFSGKMPHAEIVNYLNCADVFILPTLAEGCCNAILEAMACGLPVISSDRAFNDDILNESFSIRVDPTNIKQIRDAITLLKKDKDKREMMVKAALLKSREFEINARIEKIMNFIENVSNDA